MMEEPPPLGLHTVLGVGRACRNQSVTDGLMNWKRWGLMTRLSKKFQLSIKPGSGIVSNYAFKPTAVGVFRSNQALPCGGGLTRR